MNYLNLKIKNKIPQEVRYILNEFKKNKFSAFIVGGCVRDCILNKTPKDWDITTNAKPFQIKKIFKKSIDVGIKHGTVTVLLNKKMFEITTYRIDGDYLDKRHPDKVNFSNKLKDDLKRRDFTINAMAYNDELGLIDEFDGLKDIKNKLIKCVGDPSKRFDEDALRMMRAIRFCSKLNFNLDEKTRIAILNFSDNIKYISAERIQIEFVKILNSNLPQNIFKLYEYGLLKDYLKGFDNIINNYNYKEFLFYFLTIIKNLPKKIILRLSFLFIILNIDYIDIEELKIFRKKYRKNINKNLKNNISDYILKVLKLLKFDNKTINGVLCIIKNINFKITNNNFLLKKQISKIGKINFENYLIVKKTFLTLIDSKCNTKYYNNIINEEQKYKEILKNKEPLFIKDLNIKGEDIKKLNIKEGKIIGIILHKLLNYVLENPNNNKKNILLKMVKSKEYELY